MSCPYQVKWNHNIVTIGSDTYGGLGAAFGRSFAKSNFDTYHKRNMKAQHGMHQSAYVCHFEFQLIDVPHVNNKFIYHI